MTLHMQVGHGWGAYVAWLVAANYPDIISKVASIATPHPTVFSRCISPLRPWTAARYFYWCEFTVRAYEKNAWRICSTGDIKMIVIQYLIIRSMTACVHSACVQHLTSRAW